MGTGKAKASARSLKQGRELIFQCPACYAMVDLRAASRVANSADRAIRTGDGCLGCRPRNAPAAYVAKQLERLTALRDGERTLVRSPVYANEQTDGARLHIGLYSLCRRAEATLYTVAKAAGIPYPQE